MIIRKRVEINDLTLSIIGGVGVSSHPQKLLQNIEEYERLEIAIILKWKSGGTVLVHPSKLGIDGFDFLFGSSDEPENLQGCVGEFASWEDIERLITSLQLKVLLPSDTKVEIL